MSKTLAERLKEEVGCCLSGKKSQHEEIDRICKDFTDELIGNPRAFMDKYGVSLVIIADRIHKVEA